MERYEAFLRAERALDDGFAAAVRDEAGEGLAAAVAAVEDESRVDPDDVFARAFADLPPALREQREELRESVARRDPRGPERE